MVPLHFALMVQFHGLRHAMHDAQDTPQAAGGVDEQWLIDQCEQQRSTG
jgi:hypothetical protein